MIVLADPFGALSVLSNQSFGKTDAEEQRVFGNCRGATTVVVG
jgi:hypothetical protein